MKRRRFMFWVSFGLFGLAEKLNFSVLDRLAAAAMRLGDTDAGTSTTDSPEHWTMAENNTWRWYARKLQRRALDGHGYHHADEQNHRRVYTGKTGYLDESLVPAEMRSDERSPVDDDSDGKVELPPHVPDETRKSRHGRPPSKWLRSLNADEIRIWLKTIDVPEAGVEGMSYWTHLTRDHYFHPRKIADLTEDELAKLHAAAHAGY